MAFKSPLSVRNNLTKLLREIRLAWTLSNQPGMNSLTVEPSQIWSMATKKGIEITLGGKWVIVDGLSQTINENDIEAIIFDLIKTQSFPKQEYLLGYLASQIHQFYQK